ncbi:MAG: Cobalt ABC transporter, inner membrane subunit CbiQ [Methanoculleus marisnigri]|jgi:cobalt/nickel transport system permease protein|uniref:Cobalt ABC transporter, inner membrane subunit CbiQ n=1 Tax=Methanoculleus marisnigri TaxID=2198 RepID=A0A101GN42_9EURY|nr:cobalt ECF transporter T component CbiQ [Methanoculleus marisnigri]KUK61505.1 MAG: Cobalt ABC transporter, inner membrane subunit CbiQ [Methanoculleus marisnigri]KUL01309.1 MAG: Cobalt ABC transporter, inner membrane subunit CbiQ [Methanoculleus marisnigri]
MIDDLYFIEKYAYRESVVHRLDARIKLLIALAAIVAIVALPYSTKVYELGAVLAALVVVLWVASRLPPTVYLRRLALILPFGIFLIGFQVFVKNPYYDVFHTIATLPFGIEVYAESVQFASILLVKFVVSISFIILLSSTTRMQDMIEAAGRLGLPREFTLTLGMMVRYIFVFADMFGRIRTAMETRCFDPLDRTLPYRYRLRQIGYTVGTIFIRSYEQGERTYTSMLCRGYGANASLYIGRKTLHAGESIFFVATLAFIVLSTVLIYLRP